MTDKPRKISTWNPRIVHFVVILLLAFWSNVSWAQHSIVTKAGTVINCDILQFNEGYIRYKYLVDSQEHKLPREQVNSIRFYHFDHELIASNISLEVPYGFDNMIAADRFTFKNWQAYKGENHHFRRAKILFVDTAKTYLIYAWKPDDEVRWLLDTTEFKDVESIQYSGLSKTLLDQPKNNGKEAHGMSQVLYRNGSTKSLKIKSIGATSLTYLYGENFTESQRQRTNEIVRIELPDGRVIYPNLVTPQAKSKEDHKNNYPFRATIYGASNWGKPSQGFLHDKTNIEGNETSEPTNESLATNFSGGVNVEYLLRSFIIYAGYEVLSSNTISSTNELANAQNMTYKFAYSNYQYLGQVPKIGIGLESGLLHVSIGFIRPRGTTQVVWDEKSSVKQVSEVKRIAGSYSSKSAFGAEVNIGLRKDFKKLGVALLFHHKSFSTKVDHISLDLTNINGVATGKYNDGIGGYPYTEQLPIPEKIQMSTSGVRLSVSYKLL